MVLSTVQQGGLRALYAGKLFSAAYASEVTLHVIARREVTSLRLRLRELASVPLQPRTSYPLSEALTVMSAPEELQTTLRHSQFI